MNAAQPRPGIPAGLLRGAQVEPTTAWPVFEEAELPAAGQGTTVLHGSQGNLKSPVSSRPSGSQGLEPFLECIFLFIVGVP